MRTTIAALLAFLLTQSPDGGISGVLRTADGAPASGVRVSALARPENEEIPTAALASLVALTETDSAGHFRLDNIPPGRYYIVAGRVDTPTYYPGTVRIADGKLVAVAPGSLASGVDFTLNNVSTGRAYNAIQGNPSWVVPLQIRLAGAGKLPLFTDGQFPVLRFSRAGAGSIELPLNALSVSLPYPDWTVAVANLPASFRLEALSYEAKDLRATALQLPAMGVGTVMPVSNDIAVTLSAVSEPAKSGVRVAGKLPDTARRSIYLSGKPGTIYTDGTFEFLGVPPGRHVIVTLDNPRPDAALGAAIVVGTQEERGVDLTAVTFAPAESRQTHSPGPAGDRAPGARVPLRSIHGNVVSRDIPSALNAGRIVVNGNIAAAIPLDDEGGFQIPNLLPGRYDLEAIVYGLGSIRRSVVLDEADLTIEVVFEQ